MALRLGVIVPIGGIWREHKNHERQPRNIIGCEKKSNGEVANKTNDRLLESVFEIQVSYADRTDFTEKSKEKSCDPRNLCAKEIKA